MRKITLASIIVLTGCEQIEPPSVVIHGVVQKDKESEDDDDASRASNQPTFEEAIYFSGASPHKLGMRSRQRQPERSTFLLAAPTITASMATRSNQWPVGRAATLEMAGPWAPDTTFTWFSNTDVIGVGSRVNVTSPPSAGPVNVRGCVSNPIDGTLCVDQPYSVVAPLVEVVLDPVTTTGSWSGGRWIRIAGRVKNMPTTLPVIRLFVHTDVFYNVASVNVAADGTFSTIIHTANNVDRVAAVAMAPTYDWTTADGCNANFCFGRRDLLTGRYLPMAIDETNVQAFAVYYANRETLSNAIGELKQRSMASTVSGTMTPARFVRSELDSEACFVYDQALAAIAFVAANEQAAAEQVLNALVNVQLANGSWYFAYRANGTSDFPGGGDVRYTGAVAWVALAFNAYAEKYGITRYADAHNKVITYLQSQMLTVDGGRAIRFNPTDLTSTSWNETQQTAVEHTVDTYAAMAGYQRLTSSTAYATELTGIEQYIANRWSGTSFTPGYMIGQGANTTELYLDTQSWTMLALGAQASAYTAGLVANCDQLFEPAGTTGGAPGVRGFFHFRWRTGNGSPPFVWSEGTAGMALALQRYAPSTPCRGSSAADFMTELDSMMASGGLPASSDNKLTDFSESPATAALSWYIFARVGVNPFRTWESLTPVP